MPRLATHLDCDPIDRAAGALIRLRRKQLGKSQEDLALAIGVTFQQVQKYENGGNRISFSRLVRTARALQVPPSFFFEAVDEQSGDPVASRAALEFWRSAEGLTIAQAATKLQKPMRLALADLARRMADQPAAT